MRGWTRPLIAGRYRRGRRLGAGGMASVWGARDERTGRDVAIKVLHPHLVGDERQRARLRHEATALASIDDPHVVPVLDVIDDEAEPAIVMPRIAGETLADRLARDGALDEPAALDIALAVAEALAAAHGVGVVHRDVKPANILLGSDGVVRLMDFGIAADLDAGTSELTVDGVVGTLRYLAPERLLGDAAVPATDVWGVGVVLIEMLTGQPAYPGSTLGERLDAARQAIDRPDGVSTPTWDVIRRAADGDPTRRYPDGAALAEAIRAVRWRRCGCAHRRRGRPRSPQPPSRAARPSTASTRRPTRSDRGRAGRPARRRGRDGRRGARPGDATVRPARVTPRRPCRIRSTSSPAPVASATPAPTEAAPAEAGGKGNGKGNGKGKGHGKDKP